MSTNESVWIGLDCGNHWTSICATDADGKLLAEHTCEITTAAVTAFLERFPRPSIRLISVEAGVGTNMVRDLKAAEYPVHVFEVSGVKSVSAIQNTMPPERFEPVAAKS